jgi:hypothetical protein
MFQSIYRKKFIFFDTSRYFSRFYFDFYVHWKMNKENQKSFFPSHARPVNLTRSAINPPRARHYWPTRQRRHPLTGPTGHGIFPQPRWPRSAVTLPYLCVPPTGISRLPHPNKPPTRSPVGSSLRLTVCALILKRVAQSASAPLMPPTIAVPAPL